MARIAIIVGHPAAGSYCAALGEAYRRGAEAGGHSARILNLADLRFDPVLRPGYRAEQPLEPDLVAARAAMKEADHWVLIFPLWCGDMPAILKGFIERILQPDLLALRAAPATDNVAQAHAEWKVFKGKSARIIMTMGMPGWFYRWFYGAHALKLLKRNVLHFMGIRPVRTMTYGMVEAAGTPKRQSWLREIEALGRGAG